MLTTERPDVQTVSPDRAAPPRAPWRGAARLPAPPPPEERSWRRRLMRDILGGVVVALMIHAFAIQISVVRGHSMEPCLEDGDRLVVDRLTYTFADVSRFDVIVLGNPSDPRVDYVKRVVGVPGDHVVLHNGRLSVNGKLMPERFGPIHDHCTMQEVVVPPGSFFVLGDNRPISCDSRVFGLVPADLVRGKVRVRFWPPERVAVF